MAYQKSRSVCDAHVRMHNLHLVQSRWHPAMLLCSAPLILYHRSYKQPSVAAHLSASKGLSTSNFLLSSLVLRRGFSSNLISICTPCTSQFFESCVIRQVRAFAMRYASSHSRYAPLTDDRRVCNESRCGRTTAMSTVCYLCTNSLRLFRVNLRFLAGNKLRNSRCRTW